MTGNADLATGRRILKSRSRLLTATRAFFEARQVLEVETPVLSSSGNSDPAIEQWRTRAPDMWLRTSAEYAMKRLLCQGSGDIYELGKVFRAGEAGRQHSPEFTMLEWYRVGWNYRELMTETANFVNHCGGLFGHQWGVHTASYRELVQSHTGLDPLLANDSELRECVLEHKLQVQNLGSLDRDGLLDLIISHLVQDALPHGQITLVHDFPASQAALARIRHDSPPVAERFELYLGRLELANGYQELTDPLEQRARFEKEQASRKRDGRPTSPLDEHLLAAMEGGLPECAGVALGMDRLLMACLGASSLDEVMAIAFAEA